jgi:hypothetical protein
MNPQDEEQEQSSLIIDGGHLAHAMGTVTIKCAKKYNMNPKDIHVNIDMLIPEIEKQLGLKFNLYQQFFYQGTSNGQPNDFHKRLRRNNITIGIHEMKIQHGKPVNKETTITDPKEAAVVSTFMKTQKWLICISCILLLAPIYTVIKIVIIAFVAYMEVYHKVTFFDVSKTTDHTNTTSQKNSIWVERGVDVQIATKIIECSHGINGHTKSKICIITGDSDLKSAFVCASNATNKSANIIVLSESNCLATCLEPYLNDDKHVTLESIMEACITSYTNEFLITPRVLPPVSVPKKAPNPIAVEMPRVFIVPETTQKKVVNPNVVETPKLTKKPVISNVNDTQFTVPTIKQESSTVALVDDQLSLEVALKLHKFIATKCGNKPFFTIEMAQFYNDGNESLKAFVQKVKVKSICMTWNEILITRGSQILLANSERSQNLVNSYFVVNEPPRESYRNERESYRTEPPRESYRTEPPRESYRTERDSYRTEPPRESYRTEPPRESYRTEPPRESYRTERDSYRTEPPRESYRTEPPRESYRTERDSYRAEPPRDSYRTERDSYRTEPPRESYRTEQSKNDSDDTELLMRQLGVVWDGTIPIRSFLKDKKQILELLNLSVSETLTSIKNCFPDEPFRACFSNFETKYINTNYRSLSKLCKEIILVVEEPPTENDIQFPTVTEYKVEPANEVIIRYETAKVVEDTDEVIRDEASENEAADEVIRDEASEEDADDVICYEAAEMVEEEDADDVICYEAAEVVEEAAEEVVRDEAAEMVEDYNTMEQLLNTVSLSMAAENSF